MVEVNANVTAKHGSEIVSADIMLYNEDDVTVKEMCITDKSTLQELIRKITEFEQTYCKHDQVKNVLENKNLIYKINAKTLNGKTDGDFATFTEINELKTNKADKNHATTNGDIYGKAEQNKYGHVKLINSLSNSSFANGEALSANQGKILKDNIDNVNSNLNNTKSKTDELYGYRDYVLRIARNKNGVIEGWNNCTLALNTGDKIRLKLEVPSGVTPPGGEKYVYIYVSGVTYRRQLNSNLEVDMSINLSQVDKYYVHAWTNGATGRGMIAEDKVLLMNGATW